MSSLPPFKLTHPLDNTGVPPTGPWHPPVSPKPGPRRMVTTRSQAAWRSRRGTGAREDQDERIYHTRPHPRMNYKD
ncbi:hypothetical protein AAFF_G00328080 [Aldrovandia affinis]|uniref:Uncharacterized protein n=1 Tax=Aldrovandia affinis TaxID=143900 RepID=A0AAD7T9N0_9TELE|nr:hypothetical protein AAFF_G00328080 [Aldrovandia affinis]